MNTKSKSSATPPSLPAVQAQTWKMVFHTDFVPEYKKLTPEVKKDLLAIAKAVGKIGPTAGRPHVDSLKNPPHPNIKEMRFTSNNGAELWRVAFAFDKNSEGIILCAGNKQGIKTMDFYKDLLKKANKRFSDHLKKISSSQVVAPAAKSKPVAKSKPAAKSKK